MTDDMKNIPKIGWLFLIIQISAKIGGFSEIEGDWDVFSINQNLNSLHQGDHRFSHAFFHQSAPYLR